ncbi:hypothetical protein L479_00845 [Exiguobacterium sp. S17]|nr:hypothetical protein L479_00845 [Exiguobacterium sp. S17]
MNFAERVKKIEEMLNEDWFEMLETNEEEYEDWRSRLEDHAEQVIGHYDSETGVDMDAVDKLLQLNDEFPLLYGEDTVRLYIALIEARPEDKSVYDRYIDYLAAIGDAEHEEFLRFQTLVEADRLDEARQLAPVMPKRLGLED